MWLRGRVAPFDVTRGTLVWRAAVSLGLLAGGALGTDAYLAQRTVDTAAMLRSSVSIRTLSHVTVDRFGDSVWSSASGSGFLVAPDACEVWTNEHVVADAAIVEVFPHGWTRARGIPATVVGADPRRDVAVLSMERCDRIRPVRLGDSSRVRVGEDTYAVGNPLGRNPDSITRGIISHTDRYLGGTSLYLQTDAAISAGNSGGALFNRRGQVIGMNSAVAATRDGNTVGIGYAVPVDTLRHAVAALRAGNPSWPDAGLTGALSTLTADQAAVFGVPDGRPAVGVSRAPSGPSADKLRARDVIYRIGDTPVEDVAAVALLVAEHRPGDRLQVHIVRAGQPHVVQIELADGWRPKAAPAPDPYPGYLGLTLEMWDDQPHPRRFPAPVITQVHSLGPAHRSRIASSQRSLAMSGPFVMPIQLDVKTITGVVHRGKYHAIDSIERLDERAAAAHRDGDSLLLEIQLWHRPDPGSAQGALELQRTGFFRVTPAPSPTLEPTTSGLFADGPDLTSPL